MFLFAYTINQILRIEKENILPYILVIIKYSYTKKVISLGCRKTYSSLQIIRLVKV
jgi:hypothetical protein